MSLKARGGQRHQGHFSQLFLRSEQGKQDNVADGFGASEQHRQSVDPNTNTACGRHAVLESEQKLLVDVLSFLTGLFEQTLALHKRVIEFAVTRRDFRTV